MRSRYVHAPVYSLGSVNPTSTCLPDHPGGDTADFSQLPLLDFPPPLAVLFPVVCSSSKFCLHFALSSKTLIHCVFCAFPPLPQGELYIAKIGIWRSLQTNRLQARIELDLNKKAPANRLDRGFISCHRCCYSAFCPALPSLTVAVWFDSSGSSACSMSRFTRTVIGMPSALAL